MMKIFSFDESERNCHLPEIILSGNSFLTVDGVEEITEYTCERICIRLKKLCLSVEGDSLIIGSLGGERLTISGNILSVSFSS